MSDKFARDFAARHPHPGDDPVARLRHVVEIFGATPDNEGYAVLATSGMYVDDMATTTGLSFGDLAKLDLLIAEKDAEIQELSYSNEMRAEGQENFRQYALRLQAKLDAVAKVADKLDSYSHQAAMDGDDRRRMAYAESEAQIRAALSGGEHQ